MKKRTFTAGSIPVPTVAGDGIGKEIMPAVIAIHEAIGSPIHFLSGYHLGQGSLDIGGVLIPQETIDAFEKYKVLFKGPLATPKGKGHKSINLTLRDQFGLYNNFRPVISLPGIITRYSALPQDVTSPQPWNLSHELAKYVQWNNKNIDVIVFRENTEDLYKNTEIYSEEKEEAIIAFTLSKPAARKILLSAAHYAMANGRKKITLIHKSNIVKAYGLYVAVMKDEIAPQFADLIFEEYVVDAYCEKVVMDPSRFDVIVAPNLFGDIVSDLHLGLIGGLGFGAGANLGDEYAMFEAIHGSADGTDGIAGKGIANISGTLLSSVLMLRHFDDHETADRIQSALFYVLENQPEACTPDCLGKVDNATRDAHRGTTETMKQAIISALNNESLEFNKKVLVEEMA